MIQEITNYNDRLDTDFFQSLCNDNIVYSHVSQTDRLERNADYSKKTLIIRDGDISTGYEIFNRFNFNRVFCQNIKDKPSEKLQCIPIGMESLEYTIKNGWDKFKVIQKVREENIKEDKLLYANFSIHTHYQKRIECIRQFNGKEYLTNETTGILKHPSVLSQDEYFDFCRRLSRHTFVLCPEGNGIDTHRMWETLYLGKIPVVLRNHVTESFNDLPILILDDWGDFEIKYKEFIDQVINQKKYNLEKLTFKYWDNIIRNRQNG